MAIDYNLDPESPIVRDRLKVRPSGIQERRAVKDQSVTEAEVARNPEKYYPQWFNPNRNPCLPSSVSRSRYEAMVRELKLIHAALEMVWHPGRQVWQVYFPNENISTWWTKGWERVFMIEPWGHESLIRRIAAKLYFMKPEIFNRAKVHADRIIAEKDREQEKFDAALDEGARDNARDIYWRGLIRNTAPGNRYSQMYD